MCKQTGLSYGDMEYMTVGMCLDFIDEYVERQKPDKNKKQKNKAATQSDFDNF